MVTIFKYRNRKLYRESDSCYVNLTDIAEMAKAGEEFRVVDYKTKNEITADVLIQVIHEQDKRGFYAPVGLLAEVARSGLGFYGYLQKKACEMNWDGI